MEVTSVLPTSGAKLFIALHVVSFTVQSHCSVLPSLCPAVNGCASRQAMENQAGGLLSWEMS